MTSVNTLHSDNHPCAAHSRASFLNPDRMSRSQKQREGQTESCVLWHDVYPLQFKCCMLSRTWAASCTDWSSWLGRACQGAHGHVFTVLLTVTTICTLAFAGKSLTPIELDTVIAFWKTALCSLVSLRLLGKAVTSIAFKNTTWLPSDKCRVK